MGSSAAGAGADGLGSTASAALGGLEGWRAGSTVGAALGGLDGWTARMVEEGAGLTSRERDGLVGGAATWVGGGGGEGSGGGGGGGGTGGGGAGVAFHCATSWRAMLK